VAVALFHADRTADSDDEVNSRFSQVQCDRFCKINIVFFRVFTTCSVVGTGRDSVVVIAIGYGL